MQIVIDADEKSAATDFDVKANQAVARFQDRQLERAKDSGEDQSLLATISRIAADPNANIEKLSKVMDLYERVKAGNARAAYIAAFAEMQPEMPTITETGKIEIKKKDSTEVQQSTRYAKQADIIEAIRPILGAHGFALSHRTAQTPEGKITVTGILGHKEGHCEETTIVLQHDATGSKNAVQAVGSTISYGIRYTTRLLLNIASRAPQDGDDDGKAAGSPDPTRITEEQVIELRELLESTGANQEKFLSVVKVEKLADIYSSKFNEVKKLIEQTAQTRRTTQTRRQ